jgi:uncharacterized protein YaiL (DUF2058 family)
VVRSLPSFITKVIRKLGTEGLVEFNRIQQDYLQNPDPEEFLMSLGKLFPKHGMSMMDAMTLIMELPKLDKKQSRIFADQVVQELESEVVGSKPAAVPTAAERKAARKEREKELERKKREASQRRSRS